MRRPPTPPTLATALAVGLALASPGEARAQRGGRGGVARAAPARGGGPVFRAPVTPQSRFPAAAYNRPVPAVSARPSIVNRPNVGANRVNVMDRPTAFAGNRQVNLNGPSIVNRPQVNSNNRVTNVTNVVNNTNVINRGNTNVVGRPGFGTYPGYLNRPGFGAYPGYGNRPGFGYPARPGYGSLPGFGRPPGILPAYPSYLGGYGGYHQGWYNGYWNGQYSNRPNWSWGSFAVGSALGGLLGWGYGSSVYRWGYSSYVNPYYAAAPAIVAAGNAGLPATGLATTAYVPYDYSQPLNVDAPPPAASVADPAVRDFDAGRTFFKAGDYAGALRMTDRAIAGLPNDPAMHEFRALCLFALGRYDEASATDYAVLSVSPGWNWTTLVGLYPSVDVYTTQLRALEAYRNAHPESAPARFLLAYQYLSAGSDDAAANELRQVVRLKPADKLSAALLKQLTPDASAPAVAGAMPTTAASPLSTPNPAADPGAGDVPPADPTPAPAYPGGRAALNGSWKAEPQGGPVISLALKDDGKFTWGVDGSGQKETFDGTTSYDNGILTLARDDGSGALVGKVSPEGQGFNFRLLGSPSEDPGLSFHK